MKWYKREPWCTIVAVLIVAAALGATVLISLVPTRIIVPAIGWLVWSCLLTFGILAVRFVLKGKK